MTQKRLNCEECIEKEAELERSKKASAAREGAAKLARYRALPSMTFSVLEGFLNGRVEDGKYHRLEGVDELVVVDVLEEIGLPTQSWEYPRVGWFKSPPLPIIGWVTSVRKNGARSGDDSFGNDDSWDVTILEEDAQWSHFSFRHSVYGSKSWYFSRTNARSSEVEQYLREVRKERRKGKTFIQISAERRIADERAMPSSFIVGPPRFSLRDTREFGKRR